MSEMQTELAGKNRELEQKTKVAEEKLKQMVETYKETVPVVTHLRNPALKIRHWDKIEAVIGKPIEALFVDARERDIAISQLQDTDSVRAGSLG